MKVLDNLSLYLSQEECSTLKSFIRIHSNKMDSLCIWKNSQVSLQLCK